MASGDNARFVWEWHDDDHQWRMYDLKTCDFIENLYNNSTQNDCFISLSSANPDLYDYTVNVYRMEQQRMITGKLRQIRRIQLMDEVDTVWEWKEYNGKWYPYTLEENKTLNAAFNSQLKTCAVSDKYLVDFVTMEQTNKVTGFQRSVRRNTSSGNPTDIGSSSVMTTSTKAQQQPQSDLGASNPSTSYSSGVVANNTNVRPIAIKRYKTSSTSIPLSSKSTSPIVQQVSSFDASNSSTSYSSGAVIDKTNACSQQNVAGSSNITVSPQPSDTYFTRKKARETNEGNRKETQSSIDGDSFQPDQRASHNISQIEVDNFRTLLSTNYGDLAKLLAPYFPPTPENNNEEEQDSCPICLLEFDELYRDLDSGVTSKEVPCSLSVVMSCKHPYHLDCAQQIYDNNKRKFLSCAVCKRIFGGVQTGSQPPGGQMDVTTIGSPCAGYEGYNTFQITYSFPPGIQGSEHPNPGQPYYTSGFPRVAFIPATEEGKLVVKMLKVAFERQLVFTVGTSHTTGVSDSVVWGSIHHKTDLGGGAHGYPDPTHLSVLKEELKVLNVTENDIPQGLTF